MSKRRRSIDKTGRRSEKYDMAMSYMSESRIREEEDFRRAGMAIQREVRRKVREQEWREAAPPARSCSASSRPPSPQPQSSLQSYSLPQTPVPSQSPPVSAAAGAVGAGGTSGKGMAEGAAAVSAVRRAAEYLVSIMRGWRQQHTA